jgi:CubicO group peptidase (beta-lactamase class C family)
MFLTRLATGILIVVLTVSCHARTKFNAAAIETYLQPYVRTGNFAGDVLVEKNGKTVFEKAYGFSDRERQIPNRSSTRFHIASMSMQFTAAAVLRLVDQGSIKLDEHVAEFVPGVPGAEKITIRDLLVERSGLPDINALPDYNEILQHHQTPATLVEKIAGQPLLFEPGSKFLHEEHSAYNVLALIVEKKTGLPFAPAVKRLVFRPVGLTASGVDDDSDAHAAHMAKGYEPEGTYGLKPAAEIHWSAKTGNASVYTTAGNEARWVDALFRGHALSPDSRDAVLDTSQKVGYGWMRSENKRFGGTVYYMNGRAPGFASFVLYLPRTQMTVVLLSNIYSSATTTIGYDIAAMSMGLPYAPLHFRDPAPPPAELKTCEGKFQFGADFYQPNAEVALIAKDRELSMRWPDGSISPLIAVTADHFVDRAYWEEVKIERDASGKPSTLIYDRFQGRVAKAE